MIIFKQKSNIALLYNCHLNAGDDLKRAYFSRIQFDRSDAFLLFLEYNYQIQQSVALVNKFVRSKHGRVCVGRNNIFHNRIMKIFARLPKAVVAFEFSKVKHMGMH